MCSPNGVVASFALLTALPAHWPSLTVLQALGSAGFVQSSWLSDIRYGTNTRRRLRPDDVTSGAVSGPARQYKAALQVNPYAYIATNGKQSSYGTQEEYDRAIVDACLANDIEIVAITDHHRVAESVSLMEALSEAGVAVFPGFEANTADGVHILCIFDPSTPVGTIERYLGECGVHDASDELETSSLDCLELLGRVREWGGVAVAAHAEASKGILDQLSGQPCVNVWTSEDLIAVAFSCEIADLADGLVQIVDNRDSSYRRSHPLALIHANDVWDPDQLGSPHSSTALKMTDPTIDGIRHAFLDPDSRVRLHNGPDSHAHPSFLNVDVAGGFLDGLSLELSPELNVIIGARGTGKSTLIESVRFLVGSDPIGDDAAETHRRFIDDVLGPGARVRARVRSAGGQVAVITRTVGADLIIEDEDGMPVSESLPETIGAVTVLGQHEIAELSRHRDRCAQLIERFVPAGTEVARTEDGELGDLAVNRELLIELDAKLSGLKEVPAELADVESRLSAYDENKVKQRLDQQAALREEEPLIELLQASLGGALEEADFGLDIELGGLAEDQIDGQPSQDELAAIRILVEKLIVEWQRLSRELVEVTTEAIQEIGKVVEGRAARVAEEDSDLQQVLRELKAENINGARYLELKRRVGELKIANRQIGDVEARMVAAFERRGELLDELGRLEERRLDGRRAATKIVNDALYPAVRVSIQARGDRENLLSHLRASTRGQLNKVQEVLAEAEDVVPRHWQEVIASGPERIESDLGITEGQALKLAEMSLDARLEIDEIQLPSTMEILLNLAAPGSPPTWRELDELSTGQKATAVLLLLLQSSNDNGPLLVDQAEDDLDNAFIAGDVVRRLRDEKQRRQFILSTHNPNIPVLGDAELVARLSADGEAATGGVASVDPEHVGSIDKRSVRATLEDLEGGSVAFDTRRRRYRF